MGDSVQERARDLVAAQLQKAAAWKAEHGGSARSRADVQAWQYVLGLVRVRMASDPIPEDPTDE